MALSSISTDDAIQRWGGGIILVDGEIAHIEAIISGGSTLIAKYAVVEGNVWSAREGPIALAAIDDSLPSLGNVQSGYKCHRLSRKITKQYQRGLVAQQITQAIVGYNSMPKIDPLARMQLFPNAAIKSPAVLRQIYFPEYTPFLEALRLVTTGKMYSVAVSKDLAVGAGASMWPLVYYRLYPVGRVKGDEVLLAEGAECLREMLQEQFPIRVVVGGN